jgi:hypothetical protein
MRHVRFGSKADVTLVNFDVRFGPEPDSCTATKRSSFDQLVGELPQLHWYIEAQRFRRLQVDP